MKKKPVALVLLTILISACYVSAAMAMPVTEVKPGVNAGLDFIVRNNGELLKIPYLELGLVNRSVGVMGFLDINDQWVNGLLFYTKYPLMEESKVLPSISAALGLAKLERRLSNESDVLPVAALLFGNRTSEKINLTEIVSLGYKDHLLFCYNGSVAYHVIPVLAGNIGLIYLNDFQGNNFTSVSFGLSFDL